MGVMEIMSFISIPINIAIIVFTKKSRVYDANGVESSDPSSWRQSWENYDSDKKTPFWNEFTVILFAVMIEHVLLFAKSLLSLVIEDVPV